MKATDIRVFIPSKDFEVSKAFYCAMDFKMEPATDDLVIFSNGHCTFFLQRYYDEQFSKNLMMQLIVADIEAAFATIVAIAGNDHKYQPIQQESWGKVIYLWGPAGELWHITELEK